MLSSRKRNRPTVVCGNCRRKKTKCDRGTPCTKCVKSQMGSTCSYTEYSMFGPIESIDGSDKSNLMLREEVDTLKHKIRELEASITVASMRTGFPETPSTAGSDGTSIHTNSKVTITSSTKPNPADSFCGFNLTPDILSEVPSRSPLPLHMSDKERLQNTTKINLPHSDDSLLYPKDASINFFKDFFNMSRFPGKLNRPLPMLSLSRGDLGVQILLKYKDQMIKRMSGSITKFSAFEVKELKSPAVGVRSKLAWKQDALNANVPQWIGDSSMNQDIQKLNDYGKLIGVLRMLAPIGPVGGENDPRMLNEQVLLVLPKQKVFWKLIDRFFKYLYPVVPVVDEHAFRDELQNMFGPELKEEESPFQTVTLRQKLDWVFLGMVLIICRLSYLSVFNPSVTQNERILYGNNAESEKMGVSEYENTKYLMENGIPVDTMVVAEECLRQVDITKMANIGTFQAHFLLRFYRQQAPDEGDKSFGGDNEVLNGILLHMAYSLNLDRDPDLLDFLFDKRTKNLRRKLWHSLINTDFIDLIICGNTYSSRINSFDTKLPELKSGNSNVYDLELEEAVIKSFAKFSEVRKASMGLFSIILKMGDTPLWILLKEVENFEATLKQEYGDIKDMIKACTDWNTSNLLHLHTSLHMYLFLCTINYGLFLYYEKSNNDEMSLHYLKKLFVMAVSQMQEVVSRLLNKERKEYLPEGSYIIFAPLLLSINHNFCLVWASLVVRLISTKRDFLFTNNMANLTENDKEYLSNLESLIEIHLKLRPRDAAVSSILANSYYTGWKMKRIHFFAHKLLMGDEIYQFDDTRTRKTVVNYTSEQFSHILEVFKLESFPGNSQKENQWLERYYGNGSNESVNFGGHMSKIFGETSPSTGEDARSDAFWIQVLTQSQYSMPKADSKCTLTLRLNEVSQMTPPIVSGGNFYNPRTDESSRPTNFNRNIVNSGQESTTLIPGAPTPQVNAFGGFPSTNTVPPFEFMSPYDGFFNDQSLDDLTLYWNKK